MLVGELLTQAKNFFREDISEIVGAYFDGDKIFLTRLTESFETTKVYADGFEAEQLAEKISATCRQRGWQTSFVGFCLRDADAVTFQTAVNHLPPKDVPAFVKSWAVAQIGKDAAFSFVKVDGGEVWMEAMPRVTVENFCAAFQKFGVNLRALSVMPVDVLTKSKPLDMTEFIIDVVRNKNAPNLLTRSDDWNRRKISAVAATIFFAAVTIYSANVFLDWRNASNELDAAKISVNNLRDDLALKKILDDDLAEFSQLNKSAAQVEATKNFNLLLGLGKICGGDVHLSKIHVEEKLLELECVADSPNTVKNYLARVKSFVPNVRLENSVEQDDGEIIFTLRAQRSD